jgi:hypothetical protein
MLVFMFVSKCQVVDFRGGDHSYRPYLPNDDGSILGENLYLFFRAAFAQNCS